MDINPSLIETYTRIYYQLALLNARESCKYQDEEYDMPPTNYGDQSYNQRTCVCVLNKEILESEYNLTQASFSKSKFIKNMSDTDAQGSNSKLCVKEKDLNKRNMNEFDVNPGQNNSLDSRNMKNGNELTNQTGKKI